MKLPVVLFIDPKLPLELEWIEHLDQSAGLQLMAPTDSNSASLEALLPLAQFIVTQHALISDLIIGAAPHLRMIQRYGTRADGIDLSAAKQAGVLVATMPLHGCIAVAELAMTLILSLSKSLIRGHLSTVNGAYRSLGLEPIRTEQRVHKFQWMKLTGLVEVVGRTLGIVGFGEIGTETARRARAFGMTVVYTKRNRLSTAIERMEGVTYAGLDELLGISDFVLVAAPHTPDTDKIIGVRELALMKKSAFLVNISRGGTIDESALVTALQERQIAGAGLDVFLFEPVPFDHPLLQCDNVILTPHIGGGTGGARDRQMGDVMANIQRLLNNLQISHRVV